MEYSHVVVVRDWDNDDIYIVPRNNWNPREHFGEYREITIAYTPELAGVAICNPRRNKQNGQFDRFSRKRGRLIASGRLQKLTQYSPPAGSVAQPELHDFPAQKMENLINRFLVEQRMKMTKPRISEVKSNVRINAS